MSSWAARLLGVFFEAEKNERNKFVYLTLMYLFVIASYTLMKELKDSIFISTVGIDYQPQAKILGMLVLVPAIFFYSYLVDKLRRYQLLVFYSLFYSLCIFLFGYFLSHPEIGILNTQTSPYRIYGWLFYFFIEGFSPFVVSVFWAFANSITSPESAKKNYSLMVAGSKIGGMLSAGFAWLFLTNYFSFGLGLSELYKHQLIYIFSASALLVVPIITILLIKKVPGKDMHGYEAAYKFEKSKKDEHHEQKYFKNKLLNMITNRLIAFFNSLFGGLIMLVSRPYVLGIFGMIFFYEVLNVVLGFLRLQIAREASCDLSGLNCILFSQMFYIHLIGFIVSIFVTTPLLRKFGERRTLLLIPAITGMLVFLLLINIKLGDYKIVNIVSLVYIGIRAINYAISYPVRESLYIPTVKDIKFKSKSWIDAFGTKFAKSTGSTFNMFARTVPYAYSIFFAIIVGSWMFTAYLLGKRFDKAVKNNEVIGE